MPDIAQWAPMPMQNLDEINKRFSENDLKRFILIYNNTVSGCCTPSCMRITGPRLV